ncbi:hypothetical protein [Nodularia chucula]|uniref:hypothetical protein n=1 Tax=Nodularia chucula TaxID=3093667 RepID=UPI0039C6DFFB
MTTPNESSARFRSATEFPKTIASLKSDDADKLYQEMRDCLIFTNRSRSQLIRRNEQHKQSISQFQTDVGRLQFLISQLQLEKEQSTDSNRKILAGMEDEIGSMSKYLDQLSTAFDSVSDIDTPDKAHWGYLSFPNKFLKFLTAIKAIVLWWRDEKNQETPALKSSNVSTSTLTEEELQEKPQMSTDPASIGKSLLDK